VVKRDCSWAQYTIPAKEAFAGVTKEEAAQRNDKMPTYCRESPSPSTWKDFNKQVECSQFPIKEEPPRPAEPEHVAWRQASSREYEQCLRNNGL
jgi:hypothetical protein